MDIGDLFDKGGPVIDALSKKAGVPPDKAKDALKKIAPFVQDKLGGKKDAAAKAKAANADGYADDPGKLGGADADKRGKELLSGVDEAEYEKHVQEVARASGLTPGQVRDLMPAATTATAAAMDKKGLFARALAAQDDVRDKLDAVDGKVDGKYFGKPIK